MTIYFIHLWKYVFNQLLIIIHCSAMKQTNLKKNRISKQQNRIKTNFTKNDEDIQQIIIDSTIYNELNEYNLNDIIKIKELSLEILYIMIKNQMYDDLNENIVNESIIFTNRFIISNINSMANESMELFTNQIYNKLKQLIIILQNHIENF
eukprot:351498_1